ncbi:MAG: GDP-mannose 4,6-dehydratase [Acidobacteria bacterium]|nr:GDP-mannose 4,6-dehydratase [Acidobacteriota bacterium]
MQKSALIFGITGQDGSYLAEYLLKKGYQVHGVVRSVAQENPDHRFWRIAHLLTKITLHDASLENYPSLIHVFQRVQPDECYHLAAQSFVARSFTDEFSTMQTNIQGTHYVLSAMRHFAPHCRLYFAGSSEMFGKVKAVPQNENTPFHPRSPYGISKTTGFYLAQNYREAYDLFCCSGILFNHESPRRGMEFVTRKISRAAAAIKLGLQETLTLGNLDARRDWGFAGDYVVAMHLMLQQDQAQDYVIATGETHSVREFCQVAFDFVGLDWQKYVSTDEQFLRPAEVQHLLGDASKAEQELGWRPNLGFLELVHLMVESDLVDLEYRSRVD